MLPKHTIRRVRYTTEEIMLKWALIFGLISLVAGILGFTGVAAGAAAIAKTLFFLFLFLCVLFVALGLYVFDRAT
jgi:uncharacterized membrane protein YtjA (UPF0391 family)